MRREIEIEQAIKRQSPEMFARLATAVLKLDGHKDIRMITVYGKEKSRKGHPDAHRVLPDGRYAQIQFTSKKEQIKDKLLKDYNDAVNETLTGIPASQVGQVILCTTQVIDEALEHEIRTMANASSIDLEIYHMGRLTDVIMRKGDGILEDPLGIPVPSGSILTPDAYIAQTALAGAATDHRTPFRFREPELAAIHAGFDHSPVALLHGQPGIGKTRLALEVAQQLTEADPDLLTYVIKGNVTRIELMRRCAAPGNYLLVLDDAQDLNNTDPIIELLQHSDNERTCRIIATVRAFARISVERVFLEHAIEPSSIEVGKWSDDEVRTFLHEQFNIGADIFVDRILEVAEGKPRIAAMVGSLIEEHHWKGFEKVKEIHRAYYRKLRSVPLLEDRQNRLVLCMFAFFKHLGTPYDQQLIPKVLESLAMDEVQFWSIAQSLHQQEFVDLISEKGPCEITDPSFGVFLLYEMLVELKEVEFTELFIQFFPQEPDRFVGCVNGMLSVYGSAELEPLMKKAVTSALEHFSHSGDVEVINEIHVRFWSMDTTRSLAFVDRCIQAMKAEDLEPLTFTSKEKHETDLDVPLRIISSSCSHPDPSVRSIAFDLLLDYVRRLPSQGSQAAKALIRAYDLDEEATARNYAPQRELMERLFPLCRQHDPIGIGLFLKLSDNFLAAHGWRIVPTRNRNEVRSKIHAPKADQAFKQLRSCIWNQLFDLWQIPDHRLAIINALKEHISSFRPYADKAVIAFDATLIANFCTKYLDKHDLQHCSLVFDLIQFWRRSGIKKGLLRQQNFTNPVFQFSRRIRFHRKFEEEEADVTDERWRTRLKTMSEAASPMDLFWMFSHAHRISKELGNGHIPWHLGNSMAIILKEACKEDPGMLRLFLEREFNSGNILGLEAHDLLPPLLDHYGVEGVQSIVNSIPNADRHWWWVCFHRHLIQRQEFIGHSAHFEEVMCESIKRGTYLQLSMLTPHEPHRPGLIKRAVKQILENDTPENSLFLLRELFNEKGLVWRDTQKLFAEEPVVLQRSYYLLVDKHHLYGEKAASIFKDLLSADPSFAARWVNWRYEREYSSPEPEGFDLSFVWQREDADAIMDELLSIAAGTPKIFGGCDDYLSCFFSIRDTEQPTPEENAQLVWLMGRIHQHHMDLDRCRVVFGIIRRSPLTIQLGMAEQLMDEGPSERIFRELVLSTFLTRVVVSVNKKGDDPTQEQYLNLLRERCQRKEHLQCRQWIEEALTGLERERLFQRGLEMANG